MRKIDGKYGFSILLSSILIEFLFYLLIENLWGQIVALKLQNAIGLSDIEIMVEIEFYGILASIAISLLINLLASERIIFLDQLIAIIFSTILTIAIIFSIANGYIYYKFNSLGNPIVQIANFAVYGFTSPIILWFVILVLNSILYLSFLFIGNAQLERKR